MITARALAAGLALPLAGPVLAQPVAPMVTLLAMRPLPERVLVVELRDPDGVAVWPVRAEIVFAEAGPTKVTLGQAGLRYPLGKDRPLALRIDASRWGARPVRFPIAAQGGVRITLRYVPGDGPPPAQPPPQPQPRPR